MTAGRRPGGRQAGRARRRSTSSGRCGGRRGSRRVGHGGTLDPAASGVLPICLGEATKLAQFLLDADKAVRVHGLLRRRDRHRRRGRDGHRRAATRAPSTRPRCGARWRRSAARSRRCRPCYSALKREGRPLYDYARAGEAVEAAPRAVVVHELELTSFAGPAAAALTMRCSKGTYVRALARDLGRALGVGRPPDRPAPHPLGAVCAAEARPLDEVLAALAARRARVAAAGRARATRSRHLDRRVVTRRRRAATRRFGRRDRRLEAGRRRRARAIAGCAWSTAQGKLVAVARPARRDQTLEILRVFNSLTH